MGRVALELEQYVLPGAPAAWLFLPVASLSERGLPDIPNEAANDLMSRHPVKRQAKSGKDWIADGVVFTNDPADAREVLTVLVVGPASLADPAMFLR